jgi:hypothetical protein
MAFEFLQIDALEDFNISKLSCQMFESRRPDDYQTAHWNSYVRHIQLAINTLEQLQKRHDMYIRHDTGT